MTDSLLETTTERETIHRELEILQEGVLHDRQLNELYLEQHGWNAEVAYNHWHRDRDAIMTEDPGLGKANNPVDHAEC